MPFKQHPTDPTKVVYVTRDYMQSPNLIDACIICSDCGKKVTVDSIHTCSPQIKILTDEKIEEFAYAFELWQLNNPDKALEGIKDFARVILKEASEK